MKKGMVWADKSLAKTVPPEQSNGSNHPVDTVVRIVVCMVAVANSSSTTSMKDIIIWENEYSLYSTVVGVCCTTVLLATRTVLVVTTGACRNPCK
jgi:hypothetical protein